MDIYVSGLLWVAGAALVAACVAYLIRRIGAAEGTVENNEAAGQVFTLVGGLQAVLVAFVLISLFDRANAAEDGSYAEADSLVAAVWAADPLPAQARAEITAQARSYASTVVDDEWPRMREGLPVGDKGWNELSDLRRMVAAAPTGDDEWAIDQKSVASERLWSAYQARQQRLNTATSGGVNSVVWFALVAGAIMSLALPLTFGGPRPLTHILIVSTLAATMTLLFATQRLQNPYSGDAGVQPAAFISALARLR